MPRSTVPWCVLGNLKNVCNRWKRYYKSIDNGNSFSNGNSIQNAYCTMEEYLYAHENVLKNAKKREENEKGIFP